MNQSKPTHMSVSVAAILGEFKEIEQRSPEDVAVLMAPLLRALEAVRDGRAPQLDHAQAMAMANSLAQTAAQAGDADAAVAIAAASAELEHLAPASFLPMAAAPASPQPRPAINPFAHPYQQMLGIVGIGALSYAGYLLIQARFMPGSVASWLLTGSASLLALALALGWRRFVIQRQPGRALTVLAAVFAATAGAWAVQSSLTLRPRIAAASAEQALVASAKLPETAREAVSASTAAAATEQAESNDAPIAFWWLGDTPVSQATQNPSAPAPTAEPEAIGEPDSAAPGTALPRRINAEARPSQPDGTATGAAVPPTPVPPPSQPQTLMARYQGMLEQQVVVTEIKGARHEGKLTGVSKDGVTLLTEVMMFGEPILAHRFYLFDNIRSLYRK
jgi:hypothetical protein